MAIRLQLDAIKVTFVVLSIVLLGPLQSTEGAKMKCYYCIETEGSNDYEDCIKGGPPKLKPGSMAKDVIVECEEGCVTAIQFKEGTDEITGTVKGCLEGFPSDLMDCVKESCGQKGDCVTLTSKDTGSGVGKCIYMDIMDGNLPIPRKVEEEPDYGGIDYLGTHLRAEKVIDMKICKCTGDLCNEHKLDLSKNSKYKCKGGATSAMLEGSSSLILGIGMVAARIIFAGH